MNDFIYKSMADAIKNKLIKNLINDEEFKNLDHEGLNIKDLIETKVCEKLNSDIDFSDINKDKSTCNGDPYEQSIIKNYMKSNVKISLQQEVSLLSEEKYPLFLLKKVRYNSFAFVFIILNSSAFSHKFNFPLDL